MDTGGPLIELINCFICKSMFNQAKSIKFIVPVSRLQISNSRGKSIIEQIQKILNLSWLSHSDLIEAIIPVITKVEPQQEDLNEEDDLEILQANIHNILKNYLQNIRNKKEEEIKINEQSDSEETLNGVED